MCPVQYVRVEYPYSRLNCFPYLVILNNSILTSKCSIRKDDEENEEINDKIHILPIVFTRERKRGKERKKRGQRNSLKEERSNLNMTPSASVCAFSVLYNCQSVYL